MAMTDYMVSIQSKGNICFRCKNACGGCSWSAIDPNTNKPKFEPVPGWTAKKVLLNLGSRGSRKSITETYYITACPEFVPDGLKSDRGCS